MCEVVSRTERFLGFAFSQDAKDARANLMPTSYEYLDIIRVQKVTNMS